MKRISMRGLAAMMLAATMIVPPASGLDLLGIATVNDDNTGSLVDVTLGGGGGQILDAQVLPSDSGASLVDANVSTGGGGLGVDANIGGAVNAHVGVGGSDGLVNANVGIGGNGGGGKGNGSNGDGGSGAGGGVGLASTGRGTGSGGSNACIGQNPAQAIRLFEQTSLSGWQRASNIEIVPVQLCPDARRQVSQLLNGQQSYARLQTAVMGDTLIHAALSRTSYDAGRVLGVNRSGARLTVYVY